MIGRALALAATLGLVAGLPASAQDDDYEDYEEEVYYAKESAYVTVNAGYAHYDEDSDDTGTFGAIIGVHILPQFAMEGQYEFHGDESTNMGTYNLKFVPFFTDTAFQPWVKAGIGLLGGRPSHSFLFLGRFQAGADIFLSESLALTAAGGVGVAAHSNDFYTLSLGLSYYFE